MALDSSGALPSRVLPLSRHPREIGYLFDDTGEGRQLMHLTPRRAQRRSRTRRRWPQPPNLRLHLVRSSLSTLQKSNYASNYHFHIYYLYFKCWSQNVVNQLSQTNGENEPPTGAVETVIQLNSCYFGHVL